MITKRKNYKIDDNNYEYIRRMTFVIDLHKNAIIIKNIMTNIFYLNIYGKISMKSF